ncbi:MAG: branched-chain amino acid transport system substrate-binding protein [Solirubrobacteraceae bacterium]
MKRARPLGLLIVIALAASLVGACGDESGSGSATDGGGSGPAVKANQKLEGEVKVGLVLPLTGVNATIGADMKRGVDLALAKINSGDGVLGKKLVPVIEDSEGNPTETVAAAKKLVNVDHVPVVIGEYSSGNTIPMAQWLNRSKVPLIDVASSSAKIGDIGDYVFAVVGFDSLAGKYVAKAMWARGYRKIAFLGPNNDFGSGLRDAVKEHFQELGGRVISQTLYTEGESDYRQELQRIQGAHPDAIAITTYGKDGALIDREAFELGVTKIPMFGIYLSQDIPDADPKAVEGREGLELNTIGPGGTEYRKAYQKAYGFDFKTSFNSFAYDAVSIAAAAIDKAGSLDREKLRAAIDAVGKDYPGVTGSITFGTGGARQEQPYIIAVVKDGKIVPKDQ